MVLLVDGEGVVSIRVLGGCIAVLVDGESDISMNILRWCC